MISTRNLAALPEITVLRSTMQALAMLDAYFEPEWEYRYFSFNSRWAPGQHMGSMRNGSGDDLFALFFEHGCFIRGFAHESAMTPYASSPPRVVPGVLDHVPAAFSECLREPAFHMEDTTFCVWRGNGDACWNVGPVRFPDGEDPDGSEAMLSFYDGDPATYVRFAASYYEQEVDPVLVRNVYSQVPVDRLGVLRGLTPEQVDKLRQDAEEIGYPLNG